MSQKNLQTMIMQNFWGVKEVYYGIVQVVNARSLRHTHALHINICSQTNVSSHLLAEKSQKIFQDAIMLVILIKTDLHLLKVALIFLSKILL